LSAGREAQILLDLFGCYRYQRLTLIDVIGWVARQVFTLNRFLFGQYKPSETLIHRLDPRVKLVWTVSVMAILAFTLDPSVYAGMTVYLLALVVIARLPKESILPAAKSFSLLFAITFLLHILFAPSGGRVYFEVAGVTVSSTGIRNGLLYSYRILLFLATAMIANLTTSPVRMTDGIVRLIKPLRLIRVPVSEIGVMIFIALRFIPVLSDEARTIRAAQLSRGLRPGRGIVGRARSTIPLLMPLFLGALRRAEHLSLAIESRGYRRGVIQTSLDTPYVGASDAAFALLSAAVLLGVVLLKGIVTL
jgi:energy-coupling factor transport system permease protein